MSISVSPKESLHVGTGLGDNSDGSKKETTDYLGSLENGKFLLIGRRQARIDVSSAFRFQVFIMG